MKHVEGLVLAALPESPFIEVQPYLDPCFAKQAVKLYSVNASHLVCVDDPKEFLRGTPFIETLYEWLMSDNQLKPFHNETKKSLCRHRTSVGQFND